MKKLYLFTVSFPYCVAGERVFIQNEIYYLSKYFDEVVIFPRNINGDKQEISLDNIKIDLSLSENLQINKNKRNIYRMLSLFYPSFWIEILNSGFSIQIIKKTMSFIGESILIKKWFKQYFNNKSNENDKILIYTYWTTSVTYGLSKIANNSKIKIISRMHGIDLYEERGHISCRKETLKLLDKVYLVSLAGLEYLSNKYPQYKNKLYFSPIGSSRGEYSILDKKKNKNTFVLVSCSNIIKIKRVELIAQALKKIAASINNSKFNKIIWYHFGDGSMKKQIKELCQEISQDKILIEYNILGQVDNNEILDFYSNNQIDLFITTSSTEGRPISILEAQSFGIPVLATSVGGIPEMIETNCGQLLNQNPTVNEIAEKIKGYMNNPNLIVKHSKNSIKKWEKEGDAHKLSKAFSKEIREFLI